MGTVQARGSAVGHVAVRSLGLIEISFRTPLVVLLSSREQSTKCITKKTLMRLQRRPVPRVLAPVTSVVAAAAAAVSKDNNANRDEAQLCLVELKLNCAR